MSLLNSIYRLIKATREKKIIPIITPIPNDQLLENKVAFISGGSGGIGMAIAEEFLKSGCKVILGGTNKNKLENCKKILKTYGNSNIETVIFNLETIDDISICIRNISNIYGRIDIFVNCVGVHTENIDFWNISESEYDRVLKINLKGPYFTSIAMAKYMKDNNIKGNILLVSSSRGYEPAWSPYGISKWAINGMIPGLAKQVIKYGIIVNGIAPGPTATTLVGVEEGDDIYTNDTSINRYAMPEEIAAFARLLVSDTGNIIPGEIIKVSCGRGIFDIR
ncbi:MAG: SDR family oxidoreductase [Lachnospiraceae bacterium]|nr:SDR family oxidoreductase [Lachnospiraceae bacterium]